MASYFFNRKQPKEKPPRYQPLNACNYSTFANNSLTDLLEFYRHINALDKSGQSPSTSVNNSKEDILFNVSTYCEIRRTLKSARHKFYQPTFLLNNEKACNVKGRNGVTFVVFLVNSYREHYLRRQAMRETWMSTKFVYLNDFYNTELHRFHSLNNKRLELVHMFIVGSKAGKSNELIVNESNTYQDIVLIDTLDTYKNVIYKSLAGVKWINEFCPTSIFYVKMDDDVVLNIFPLLSRLYFKFGLNYSRGLMYGEVRPNVWSIRTTNAKWYVENEKWPFQFYPKHYPGYAFIANFQTMKIIYEQSKMIPRFWIDDVYLFGILMHGIIDKQVDSFDFRSVDGDITVGLYNYWRLDSELVDYDVPDNKTLKLVYKQPVDFFLDKHIVIIHLEFFNASLVHLHSLLNSFTSLQKSFKTENKKLLDYNGLYAAPANTTLHCEFKTFSDVSNTFVSCLRLSRMKSIDSVRFSLTYKNADCLVETSIRVNNCLDLNNQEPNLFYIYFYHFAVTFWQKTQ
jgi:beta-1,3-galactosyltransferase 1